MKHCYILRFILLCLVSSKQANSLTNLKNYNKTTGQDSILFKFMTDAIAGQRFQNCRINLYYDSPNFETEVLNSFLSSNSAR